LAVIPFAMAGLAALLTMLTATAWRRRWWDLPRRSLMSVFVVGALAAIAFLIRWNYLPAVF